MPAGTYRIGGRISLNGRHDIVVKGAGDTTVFDAPVNENLDGTTCNLDMWRLGNGATNIQLRDFTIDGFHPNPGTYKSSSPLCEWAHGVSMGDQPAAPSDIEIGPNLDIRNVRGDCVYVNTAGVSNVLYHDSTCIGNGRMGIAIITGTGIEIHHVTFTNMAYSAIDIEANSPGEDTVNVWFHHNSMGGTQPRQVFAMGGPGNIDNVRIEDNASTGPNGLRTETWASFGARRTNVIFQRNTSTQGQDWNGSSAPGQLFLDSFDGVRVLNNVLMGGGICVRLVNSTAPTVSGNTGCSPQIG